MEVPSPLPRFISNLDTCTEVLGCETGVAFDVPNYHRDTETPTPRCSVGAAWSTKKKKKHCKSASEFPPSLTILSGEARLRLVSQREKGRLLLFPVKPSVVEAQRQDGSFRLLLFSSEPFGEREKESGAEEDNTPAAQYSGGVARGCLSENSDGKRLLQLETESGPCSLTLSAS